MTAERHASSMYIYYSDDENKLSDGIKDYIERAAQLAVASELEICEGREVRLDADEVVRYNSQEIPFELSVSVVSDKEIRSINSEYRGIDKVTDVLSFPQFESVEDLAMELADAISENDSFFSPMLGDVVLCYEKACEQAEEYETGVEREIVYLTVHSIFHLLGYDHMAEDDKKEMRAREEAVMTALGLSQ
mgnify:FL=1